MTLTRATFKRDINATILDRGRRYYDSGKVTLVSREADAFWQAEVSDTEDLLVSILIEPDGALNWICHCPYDAGPVCKHVVAVLYAIDSELGPMAAPPQPPPPPPPPSRAELVQRAIERLSKADLVALLVELSQADPQLAHTLLTRYGAPETDKAAAHRQVTEALGFHHDRYGSLDYRGAIAAARSVSRLLMRAEDLLESGHAAESLLLYQAVLEEVVTALGYADDSNGSLGGIAYDAMEGLQEAAGHLPPDGRAALFDYCITHCYDEIFSGWDWGWDLAVLAGNLITTPQQRAVLFAALDRKASHDYSSEFYSNYERERAAEIKLDIIEQHDGAQAVQAFLEANIAYEAIRIRLAHWYLDLGDLEAARGLCAAWLDDNPADYMPGLRSQFLTILLTIAERTDDRAEQIRLLDALFNDRSDMTHYNRLRALVGPAAWPSYRADLLLRLQALPAWRVNLGRLYAAEGLWAELLDFVRRHPTQLHAHHKDLAGRFPRELAAIYEQLAQQEIDRHPNRGGYQTACTHLLAMQSLGQGDQAAAVVARWRVDYKHRPALLDELRKAFGTG